MPARESRLPTVCAVAVLFAAALALYWSSLGYPRVFDDLRVTPASLKNAHDNGFVPHLRGLTTASFGWVYGSFGADWRWQRLVNILLHAAVAATLFLFLRRLHGIVLPAERAGTRGMLAFLGAVLFLASPVAVYGVAYVVERSIVLATLFSLISLRLFLEGLARGRQVWFVAAAAAYLAAIFAKEHCVMLPAVAAALAVLVGGWPPRPLRSLALPAALYGAVAMLAILLARGFIGRLYEPFAETMIRETAQAAAPSGSSGYVLSVLNQGYLFFRYVLTWLAPLPALMSIDLRPAFPSQLAAWPQTAGFLAWLAWPAVGGWLLLKRGRPGLAGFAMLAPWLFFLTEVSTARVQEPLVLYRSYLWMCLWPAALPALLARLRLAPAAALLFVAALAQLYPFADRLRTFSSELAVWDDAARKVPGAAVPFADRPYRNRGVAWFNLGRDDEAVRDFNRAIELAPRSARGWILRGTAYMRAAQSELARADFDRALELDPANAEVLARRCIVLMRLAHLDEALADCRRSVELQPEDASAHVVLGMALALRGDAALAERHYRRALALDPADGSAHYQYGVLLRGTGRAVEARRQLEAACRARVDAACRALP